MGRPTKLTEERQEALCNLLRRAISIEAACQIVGIDESLYYKWRKRGREELQRVAEDGRRRVRKDEKPYVAFFKESTRAQGEAEQTLTKHWYNAANEDWRAAMELLQRKFPERWSKKQKHEHSGPEGGPMRHQWGPPRDTEDSPNTSDRDE